MTRLELHNLYMDSPFGQQRVAFRRPLLSSALIHDELPNVWQNTAIGGAPAATYDSAVAAVKLGVDAIQNHEHVRQTYRSWNYRAGQGQIIQMTAMGLTPVAGVRKQLGYARTEGATPAARLEDGIYFEINGTTDVAFGIASTTGAGSQRVAAASWNLDRFGLAAGLNPSGVQIDLTRGQILFWDLQWLGQGTVLCGFLVDRELYYAHAFHNANARDRTYMRSASLPAFYRVWNETGKSAANDDVGGAAPSLYAACADISREGSADAIQQVTTASRLGADGAWADPFATSTITNTEYRSIVAVRMRASHREASLLARAVEILNLTTSELFWALVLEPTIGSGAYTTWTRCARNSGAEQSVDQPVITGAQHVIASGYTEGGSARGLTRTEAIEDAIAAGRSRGASTGQVVALIGRSVAANKAVQGALTFAELF